MNTHLYVYLCMYLYMYITMYVHVHVYKCTLERSESISSPIYSNSIRIIKYSGNTNNLGFQVTTVRNLRKLNRQHVQHQRILIHVDMACSCHDMQGKEIWILLGGLITFISTAHTIRWTQFNNLFNQF